MKKIIVKILLMIMLMVMLIVLSGCTLKIETTDNSVSASVDGETTEKVDNIINWIKERLSGIFQFEKTENTESEPIGNGDSTIL